MTPYEALVECEAAYLIQTGWTMHDPDSWQEPPGRKDRLLRFGHAVNSQKAVDRAVRR